MGTIKRLFGWSLFFLGCYFVAGTILSLPHCNGIYEMIGGIIGGILFGLIFLYFGWKWIRGT
jgi:hypothetical protein